MEGKKLQKCLAGSLNVVAYNAACESLRLEQKALRELRLLLIKESDPDTKKILQDGIDDSTNMIFKLKYRISKIEEDMNNQDED